MEAFWKSKPVSIMASAIGLTFGYWAGLNLLIPVAIFAVAVYAGKRFFPASKAPALVVISFQVGQLVWMLLAVFVPSGLAAVISDIIIMAVLIVWLYIRQSRAAAITAIVYNVLSLSIYGYELFNGFGTGPLAGVPVTTAGLRGLSVHIVWRVATIFLLILFIRTRSPKADLTKIAQPT